MEHTIAVTCPSCSCRLKVRATAAGQLVRCPKCGTKTAVPDKTGAPRTAKRESRGPANSGIKRAYREANQEYRAFNMAASRVFVDIAVATGAGVPFVFYSMALIVAWNNASWADSVFYGFVAVVFLGILVAWLAYRLRDSADETDTIQFVCPACDGAISALASLQGAPIRCPNRACNRIVTVPIPDDVAVTGDDLQGKLHQLTWGRWHGLALACVFFGYWVLVYLGPMQHVKHEVALFYLALAAFCTRFLFSAPEALRARKVAALVGVTSPVASRVFLAIGALVGWGVLVTELVNAHYFGVVVVPQVKTKLESDLKLKFRTVSLDRSSHKGVDGYAELETGEKVDIRGSILVPEAPWLERYVRTNLEEQGKVRVKSLSLGGRSGDVFTGTGETTAGEQFNVTVECSGGQIRWKVERKEKK